MNPPVEPPPPALAPPQPHRPSTSCVRHPEEHFTSFCPLCLCERLHVLDSSSSPPAAASSSSSRKPPIAATTSSATAALKAIFKPSGGGGNRPGFFPELRRTKSFSASKNEGLSGGFEPQRKSCDVRARNTLWSLFHHDAERNPHKKEAAGNGRSSEIVEAEAPNLCSSSSAVQGPVFESKEDGRIESETNHADYIEIIEEEEEEQPNAAVVATSLIEEKVEDIAEEYEEELMPMKDHIDLDSQTKKAPGRDFKEIAGSFWSAASVFSKKLQKWRQKQKLKKRRNDGGSARLAVEKPNSRKYRETQSEIADYGFERRSCDTEPRFSLDDPRYSFDEARASWDGYLIGRTFPRMPTMVSVVEDAPVVQIPVEDPPAKSSSIEDESLPGGSAQTRDYYYDSSSRRRKSLDRSSSISKITADVVAVTGEVKSVSNANVDYFNGPKLVVPDRDSNSNSLRDDYSEIFESVNGTGDRKGLSKKSRRWSKAWNILGFINRRSVNKDEDEDRYSRANDMERYSGSWSELRGERNGDVRGGFNPTILRSNSSISWRSSSNFGVGARYRSARYSPNNVDNGLLRFYLTPTRGSRRCGSGKNRASHAHSIARSLLRLY
ncbi:OCTOPUS [Hibiscus trionum]|uniref:OCTOPUS n=1 Tax=Hibiscus trionum TaxID=183268 RepID=A0A9W7MFQ9_HIBTR|nr:OCTOPUS [Hibiscus trionum]